MIKRCLNENYLYKNQMARYNKPAIACYEDTKIQYQLRVT